MGEKQESISVWASSVLLLSKTTDLLGNFVIYLSIFVFRLKEGDSRRGRCLFKVEIRLLSHI